MFLPEHHRDFLRQAEAILANADTATTEIDAAIRRHPDLADRIHASFPLLRPTHELMRNETIYQSHCRELITRIIAERDTRPGTAAECCLAMRGISLLAPLTCNGNAVYHHVWHLAGLPDPTPVAGHSQQPAAPCESVAEDETSLRTRLTQLWRRPTTASGR